MYRAVAVEFREGRSKDVSPPAVELSEEQVAPPGDDHSLVNYRQVVASRLQALPPAGFERFCQRLLRESGFEEVTITGRSGDGGIDGIGILQVNALVSFKVLFHCKRYTGSVTPSQVRDFRGAMMGRADKGIITTGSFTADAGKEAVRDGVAPIELVDGEKLVSMLEHLELGLEPRRTFEVDPTFFVAIRELTETGLPKNSLFGSAWTGFAAHLARPAGPQDQLPHSPRSASSGATLAPRRAANRAAAPAEAIRIAVTTANTIGS